MEKIFLISFALLSFNAFAVHESKHFQCVLGRGGPENNCVVIAQECLPKARLSGDLCEKSFLLFACDGKIEFQGEVQRTSPSANPALISLDRKIMLLWDRTPTPGPHYEEVRAVLMREGMAQIKGTCKTTVQKVSADRQK
jgi:hypothetical protein